jgi:hypothetical protein
MTKPARLAAMETMREILSDPETWPHRAVQLARLCDELIRRGKERVLPVYAAAMEYARTVSADPNTPGACKADHHAWLKLRTAAIEAYRREQAEAEQEEADRG